MPFAASAARLPIKKAVEFSMLPNALPILDRFQLARDCGFEQIECPTTPETAKAEEMLAASHKAGLPIHSVMNSEHWRSPLSSPDPAVVEKSMEGMRTSLGNAKLWGANTVLLVPAVVTPKSPTPRPGNAASARSASSSPSPRNESHHRHRRGVE